MSEQFLIASEVAFVSDIADMKFPPIERKTLASRCNILLTASTESSPLVWRFCIPNSLLNESINSDVGLWLSPQFIALDV